MKSQVFLNGQFTRPDDTTQYSVGDIVGNATDVLVPIAFPLGTSGGVMLRRAYLNKNDVDITGASFRLHLWLDKPTQTNQDNEAFELRNLPGYLGYYDFTMVAGTDGAYAFAMPALADGAEIMAANGNNGNIYGILEARGTYTPAALEVFKLRIDTLSE